MGGPGIEIGLNAAIVAVVGQASAMAPAILCVPGNGLDALPSGPFDPLTQRTMEAGLRRWVEEQTGLSLGYVEQLYTFGDRGRHRTQASEGAHVVSVGYLALTRPPAEEAALAGSGARFRTWYGFLPWEDFRAGRPALLDEVILPGLAAWARQADRTRSRSRGMMPSARVRLAFGLDGAPFDEERALDRYELIYSAGLVEESVRDGRYPPDPARRLAGQPMLHDHRRILATAVSRLRAKVKYRPVIFELMPATFTLTELQRVLEMLLGRPMHKQNFRRLVESAELVEPTGETSTATGGRPAALFRFRAAVLEERPFAGLRVGRRG